MGKAGWGLLISAAALLPGVATAQDWQRGRGDRGPRAAAEQPAQVQAPARPERPQGGNGGARGDGQRGNGDGWQRPADGVRPNWQGRQPVAQPNVAPAPTVTGQALGPATQGYPRGRDGYRNGNRDGSRPDWRGRTDGAGTQNGLRGGSIGANRAEELRRSQLRDGGNRAGFGWQRNGADWNDQRRDDGRFDQRRFENRALGNRYDDRSGWNRGWRNDNRYDWSRYRTVNRGAYHLPRYYAPYGWGNGYRRFSIGVTLSSILFAENYWIDDPWDYRLPPADGPYRWVRYYNDALLVDVRYGEVVDVVYDIFW